MLVQSLEVSPKVLTGFPSHNSPGIPLEILQGFLREFLQYYYCNFSNNCWEISVSHDLFLTTTEELLLRKESFNVFAAEISGRVLKKFLEEFPKNKWHWKTLEKISCPLKYGQFSGDISKFNPCKNLCRSPQSNFSINSWRSI